MIYTMSIYRAGATRKWMSLSGRRNLGGDRLDAVLVNIPVCHPSDPGHPARFEVPYCRRVVVPLRFPFRPGVTSESLLAPPFGEVAAIRRTQSVKKSRRLRQHVSCTGTWRSSSPQQSMTGVAGSHVAKRPSDSFSARDPDHPNDSVCVDPQHGS